MSSELVLRLREAAACLLRGRIKLSSHPYERLPVTLVTADGYAGRKVLACALSARSDVDVAEVSGGLVRNVLRAAIEAEGRPPHRDMALAAYDRQFRLLLLNLLWPRPRHGWHKPRVLVLFCGADTDWADRFFRVWGARARMVQVVSNAVCSIASSAAHVHRGQQTFENACRVWGKNRQLAEWLAVNPRFRWVREDELLAEPSSAAGAAVRVCAFMGIPTDGLAQAQELLINLRLDGSHFGLAPMRPADWQAHWSLQWRSWDEHRRSTMAEICGPDMAYFGYTLPWADPQPVTPSALPAADRPSVNRDRLLVVAHYKEELSWLARLPPTLPHTVYSMTDPRYHFVANDRAYEVPCYLKFIIDRYDSLPRKIILSQAHRTSWHQDFPMDVMATHLNWEAHDYLNLSREDNVSFVSPEREKDPPIYQWLTESWPSLFGEYVPLPPYIFCYVSAQFLVDRECIRRLPLCFWKHCYEWLENTPLPAAVTARIFEYSWAYLFTGNAIEPRRSYRDIFQACSRHHKEISD